MSIFVPFNFQPVSATRYSGAYTIPAGFYAHVTAFCEPGSAFLFGGSALLTGYDLGAAGVDFAVIAVAVNNISNVNTYTVPTGYYFQGQTFGTSGAPEVSIGGERAPLGVTIYAGSGQVISGNAGAAFDLTGVAIRNSSPNDQREGLVSASYWFPSGSALNVSNIGGSCYYLVSLFNNIA